MNPITCEGLQHEKERRDMVRDALQEKAPKLYRQLKKSKKLEKFVADLEKELMSAFREERRRVMQHQLNEKNAKSDWAEQVGEIEAQLGQAWEETLATFLEFSD